MKIISWNVNGLRAVIKKDFVEYFNSENADIFCIQETKLQPDQIDLTLDGYHMYYHSGEKKGYSSTAVYTKVKPISINYDFKDEIHPLEGRVMTLEFEKFYLVNAYVPNSQEGLKRLLYREEFEDSMLKHLKGLDKPVVYCGDLNVAHNEIDLKNPKTNHNNAGFSDKERSLFTRLLENGFKDTFRELYPDTIKYSWFSYRFSARTKNIGWRIDYFIVSDDIIKKVIDSKIYNEILGSDHCPISLEIKID